MADFLHWASAIAWIAAGSALLWFIDKRVYPVCPACSHTHSHDHDHCSSELHGFAPPLLIAVGLHAALDGHAPWLDTLRVCAQLSQEDRSALQTQLRALLHHHCGVTALRTRQLMVELQSL